MHPFLFLNLYWPMNCILMIFRSLLLMFVKQKHLSPFPLDSFQYNILQNHIQCHTNPYLETHKSKINPSNVYTVNSILYTLIMVLKFTDNLNLLSQYLCLYISINCFSMLPPFSVLDVMRRDVIRVSSEITFPDP